MPCLTILLRLLNRFLQNGEPDEPGRLALLTGGSEPSCAMVDGSAHPGRLNQRPLRVHRERGEKAEQEWRASLETVKWRGW